MIENLKLVIDQESVNIYIDNGDDKDPTNVVYWHEDEWIEDPSIVPSIINAVFLFFTDKAKLLNRIGLISKPKFYSLKDNDNGDVIAVIEVSDVLELFGKAEIAVTEELAANEVKLVGRTLTLKEDREKWATMPTKPTDVVFTIYDNGIEYERTYELSPVVVY